MKRWNIGLTLMAALSMAATACNEPSLDPWTTLSTIKVRPFESPEGLDLVAPHLYCARNEWEAVQVVVRNASSGALAGCDVVVSPLQGPGDDIDTIGGLILNSLGHLPKRGERVVIGNLQFKVLRADSRRVHLLEVSPAREVRAAARR